MSDRGMLAWVYGTLALMMMLLAKISMATMQLIQALCVLCWKCCKVVYYWAKSLKRGIK